MPPITPPFSQVTQLPMSLAAQCAEQAHALPLSLPFSMPMPSLQQLLPLTANSPALPLSAPPSDTLHLGALAPGSLPPRTLPLWWPLLPGAPQGEVLPLPLVQTPGPRPRPGLQGVPTGIPDADAALQLPLHLQTAGQWRMPQASDLQQGAGPWAPPSLLPPAGLPPPVAPRL
jgi:hypothetical protein